MPSPKPPRYFATAADFRAWLAEHAGSASELLVGFHKRGSGLPSMTWPESVDEALCVGWIDGVRKRIDDERYQIRFTPRRAGSIWSAINIARVAVLEAEGRMRPAGRAAFAQRTEAKSRVYAYEQSDTPEFTAAQLKAFRKEKAAYAWFEQQPPGYRKLLTRWVINAKKPQTQAKRLATLIAASAAGQRL